MTKFSEMNMCFLLGKHERSTWEIVFIIAAAFYVLYVVYDKIRSRYKTSQWLKEYNSKHQKEWAIKSAAENENRVRLEHLKNNEAKVDVILTELLKHKRLLKFILQDAMTDFSLFQVEIGLWLSKTNLYSDFSGRKEIEKILTQQDTQHDTVIESLEAILIDSWDNSELLSYADKKLSVNRQYADVDLIENGQMHGECWIENAEGEYVSPVNRFKLMEQKIFGSGQGFIYVLTNPTMPGIVKIGITNRSVENRASELTSSTGVAMPFEVAFQLRVSDMVLAEEMVFTRISQKRLSSKREFFSLSLDEAQAVIEQVATEIDRKALTKERYLNSE